MALPNQPDSYKKTQIETASPEALILMLYDGALRFIANAEEASEKKNLEGIHNSLVRVQAIIAELLACLNKEKGGEIAVNLERLYIFFLGRLADANISKDLKQVREIKPLIEDLRKSWAEMMKQNAKNPPAPTAPGKRLSISA